MNNSSNDQVKSINDLTQALTKAELICQNSGKMLTPLRREILQLILGSAKPVKAYAILAELKAKKLSDKPITVYRVLDFLRAHHLIHKIDSLNAYAACRHPEKKLDCYFLICQKCQAIKECCNQAIDQAILRTVTKSKFTIKHVTLEISGICEACYN